MPPTLRAILRSGPTSLVVVASLGLGIGAVASVWTTASELLWTAPPFPEPEQLLTLYETSAEGEPRGVALANLLDFQTAETIAAMAAYRPRTFGLRRDGEKTRVIEVGQVTEGFFRTLAVAPERGRDFEGADEPRVIIVADGLASLGEVLLLNEEPRTVIGVLPPAFRFPMARGAVPVAFIPLSHADYGNKRDVRTLEAIVRLAPGRAADDARGELETIAARLRASYPDTNTGFDVALVPLAEVTAATNASQVELLGAVALSLLLIVGVNLGTILLARRASRADELKLRRALGARPRQLFRLLFAESAVLGLAGAGLGLVVAARLLGVVPAVIAHLGGGAVEPPELAFGTVVLSLGLALGMAFVFALPFYVRDVRLRSRRLLIAGQFALGALLVQSTVLLGRSFVELSRVDPGFETERVLTFGLGLPEAVYDQGAMFDFHHRLVSELESIPGVRTAGAAAGGLLDGRIRHRASFRLEEASVPRRDWPSVSVRIATPGYFESLSVPLLRGRPLAWSDDAAHPNVVLVNRAYERAHLPDGALGRRVELSWKRGELLEIVGVVADVRQVDLATEAAPEVVLPMGQQPAEYGIYTLRLESADLGTERAVAAAARDAVDRLDGRLETIRLRSASEWVATSLAGERLSLGLVSAAAVSALGLATLGTCGLLLAVVLKRRRELAIRLALGAERSAIRRLVSREGLRLAAAGTLAGTLGFALLLPWLRSRLYGVGPFDPASSAATLALIATAAFLSCAWPARRAARTRVAAALRSE